MPTIDSIYKKLITVIEEVSDIDSSKITLETNVISDLAIDSLDFLDIVFAIDKEYNIHLPVELWLQEINNTNLENKDPFTIINICKEIEKLIK